MNKNNFLAVLACGVLGFGCSEAKKTAYTLYEFADVDSSKFHAKESKVHSVTSSGQGMVYVAGQTDDDTVVIDRTDGASWQQMDLSTGKTPAGVVHTFAIKDAKASVKVTSSLHDGVMVYVLAPPYVMGVLNDSSTDASIAWRDYEDAGFSNRRPAIALLEWKSADRYVFLSSINEQPDGLRFFESGSSGDQWAGGFNKTATKPQNTIYTSAAITPANELLLSGQDGQIYKMDEASFKDKHLAHDGEPVVLSADLQRGPFANAQISKMLYVDKYLLVGFNGGERKQGGLFFKDVSSGLPSASQQWDNVGEGLDITGMIVDRNNPKRAVIATNKGVMIFEDGKVEHFTKYMMNNPANKGRLDKSAPQSGAAGSVMSDYMTSVAQDKAGKFYFSTSKGVSTLVIRSEDF